MKRVRFDDLMPADIVLTARRTKTGRTIRATTWGKVSHAMICVQHGSVIDSTPVGVHSRSLQRDVFDDDEKVFVFRLRERPAAHVIAQIVDEARNSIGTRYSKREAARALFGQHKPRNRRQFCSRLVARAYRAAGIPLVADSDYCTPDALRRSPLLLELGDPTVPLSPVEADTFAQLPSVVQMTENATNSVLDAARRIDPEIETFEDIDELVEFHPEWDQTIAQAYRDSGYLALWSFEDRRHPWRFDLDAMDALARTGAGSEIRHWCIDTIGEAFTGGKRYAANLHYYEVAQKRAARRTWAQLVQLYKIMVDRNHERVQVARAWLTRHHPGDVTKHFERIEPHSDLWFSIVDKVEPNLAALARQTIAREGATNVCSACGDTPAYDYEIVNAPVAMPGVPALRLCDDCVRIRRGFGELLQPMP